MRRQSLALPNRSSRSSTKARLTKGCDTAGMYSRPGRLQSANRRKPMQRKPAIMFRAGELESALKQRGGNANEIAKRDLARYYRLLDQELASIELDADAWRI